MKLDANTLFLVTIYVESILGLLLLFAWAQNFAIHAVAWWGSAHLLRAGSITLFGMYGQFPDVFTIDLALPCQAAKSVETIAPALHAVPMTLCMLWREEFTHA